MSEKKKNLEEKLYRLGDKITATIDHIPCRFCCCIEYVHLGERCLFSATKYTPVPEIPLTLWLEYILGPHYRNYNFIKTKEIRYHVQVGQSSEATDKTQIKVEYFLGKKRRHKFVAEIGHHQLRRELESYARHEDAHVAAARILYGQ